MKKAVLLMAHGAPRDLDSVEEYVLHIRHGRPLQPELMADIVDRYRKIGGSPLLKWTTRQAELLQNQIQLKVYVGMRHSNPFIQEAISQIISDGIESIVAVCMAPQFSKLTIGAYQKSLEDAIANTSSTTESSLRFQLVGSYARHPQLIQSFHSKLAPLEREHPDAPVLFTAHSLPQRVLQEGDPYDYEVKETARLVANASGLKEWKFSYQSQGLTNEKWLGPTVEARIDEFAAQGRTEILIQPIGFVCDHVEVLYDIDISFQQTAQNKGIRLYRVPSLNDSAEFIQLLASLVSERL
jgi:protoporphyrin/coproporphyrin ferrochelatase